MKPIILIPTSNVVSEALKTVTGDTEILYSDRRSAATVIEAGGLPVFMPTFDTPDKTVLEQYLAMAGGVFVPGEDTSTDPQCFGETNTHTPGRIDAERDRSDIALIKLAYERKLPILGICKGMQIINVALGGTLYQDITQQHQSAIDHDVRGSRTSFTHQALLTSGSILGKVYKDGIIRLNGGHQQAVKQLSDKLVGVAVSEDGIIEAFEAIDYPFLLGTQFHLELQSSDQTALAVFEAFITAAKTKA